MNNQISFYFNRLDIKYDNNFNYTENKLSWTTSSPLKEGHSTTRVLFPYIGILVYGFVEIWTLDSFGVLVFKTSALNHSATDPFK